MRVFVTGTSRGIGLELTRQLAERGDQVVASARAPDTSTKLGALRSAHPDRVEVVELDVASAESVAGLEQRRPGRHRRLDQQRRRGRQAATPRRSRFRRHAERLRH
ncbi:MAG: SDR family NAD(P)-dependent oxidoreductase [Myxococcales bacterium]|nr:SDR family NAD(P)-dependent oxidoreductase [Myxococcales bacterium]